MMPHLLSSFAVTHGRRICGFRSSRVFVNWPSTKHAQNLDNRIKRPLAVSSTSSTPITSGNGMPSPQSSGWKPFLKGRSTATQNPRQSDKASVGRIKYLEYTDYVREWDAIGRFI